MDILIFLLDTITASLSLGLSLSFFIDNNYQAAAGWFVSFLGFTKISIHEWKIKIL